MNALQIEERVLRVNTSLSLDLARHITGRLHLGQVVIVSKQPGALLASTRKQWLRVQRQVENRRSGTTEAIKIASYTTQITRMQTASFSARPPLEEMWPNIIFATAKELVGFVPRCLTMYVATPTDNETLHKITSSMPENGLVVVYKSDLRKKLNSR
jgi:hypothetical protein